MSPDYPLDIYLMDRKTNYSRPSPKKGELSEIATGAAETMWSASGTDRQRPQVTFNRYYCIRSGNRILM